MLGLIWLGVLVLQLTLEEECGLVGNQVTGEILRCVHQAGDDCAAEISAFEKIEEGRGSTHLGFNLDGTLHHGEGLLGLVRVFVAEALNGTKGFCLASAADEPPGRFGGEEDQNQERGLDKSVWGLFGKWASLKLTGKSHCRARGTRQAHSSDLLL
jgi:hypothetical protein